MTVNDFLTNATQILSQANIPTARLDCLILLEDALQLGRAHLLAHPDTKIPQKTEVELNKKVTQRATHLPLAYLRGKTFFYGREFIVGPEILVPRPESESIIDLLKIVQLPLLPNIVDVGTGSGCLGITAALEIPDTKVWLCDIDPLALNIARQNTIRHHVAAHLVQSDLLGSIRDDFDIVLSNLPYVPAAYPINEAARHEPKLALFAGPDGLDLYRRLWHQLGQTHTKPQFVLTESLPVQHAKLTTLAQHAGYKMMASDGLAQCFRLNLSAQRQV